MKWIGSDWWHTRVWQSADLTQSGRQKHATNQILGCRTNKQQQPGNIQVNSKIVTSTNSHSYDVRTFLRTEVFTKNVNTDIIITAHHSGKAYAAFITIVMS
jgi:hypothetical protein